MGNKFATGRIFTYNFQDAVEISFAIKPYGDGIFVLLAENIVRAKLHKFDIVLLAINCAGPFNMSGKIFTVYNSKTTTQCPF